MKFRKDFWKAADDHFVRTGQALDMTSLGLKVFRRGVIVFSEDSQVYCDGRAVPEPIANTSGRKIVFMPHVDLPKNVEPVNNRRNAIV